MKKLLATLLLLLPLNAFADISFVSNAEFSGVTSNSDTVSITVSGSNTYLMVWITGDVTSDLITGVTYNGTSMTQLAKDHTAVRWGYLYGLVNPTTGANNLVISASGSQFIRPLYQLFAGVNQATPLDGSAVIANTCVVKQFCYATTTTSVDKDFIFGGAYNSVGTMSAPTGTTLTGTNDHGAYSTSPRSIGDNSIGMYSSSLSDTWSFIIQAIQPVVTVVNTTNNNCQGYFTGTWFCQK
jgi:hypothetical protein